MLSPCLKPYGHGKSPSRGLEGGQGGAGHHRPDLGHHLGHPLRGQKSIAGDADYSWLVVWNMTFMTFHSVGNFIIPTDFHIVQRGWNHQPDICLKVRISQCSYRWLTLGTDYQPREMRMSTGNRYSIFKSMWNSERWLMAPQNSGLAEDVFIFSYWCIHHGCVY